MTQDAFIYHPLIESTNEVNCIKNKKKRKHEISPVMSFDLFKRT